MPCVIGVCSPFCCSSLFALLLLACRPDLVFLAQALHRLSACPTRMVEGSAFRAAGGGGRGDGASSAGGYGCVASATIFLSSSDAVEVVVGRGGAIFSGTRSYPDGGGGGLRDLQLRWRGAEAVHRALL